MEDAMKNGANEENGCDRLMPITVRFSEEAMQAIEELAREYEKPKAEIIRAAVDNRLEKYLGNLVFIDAEQGAAIRKEVFDLASEMQAIKAELRRIGINYNQEIKLRQIEKKQRGGGNLYERMQRIEAEKAALLKENKTLDKAELEQLMQRYEAATEKVGDAICHILG